MSYPVPPNPPIESINFLTKTVKRKTSKIMKTKSIKKKPSNTTDSLVTQLVLHEMGKNPLCFVPIINEIVSEGNPDSRKIIQLIAEGLVKAAVSQKELVKEVKERILDMISGITSEQVMNIVNQQRLSLSKDSKKFLEEVGRAAMVDCCERYFNEKRKEIDKILSDYFKTINGYIENQISKASEKYIDKAEKLKKEHEVTLTIPDSMKDDVVKYVEFLQSKK